MARERTKPFEINQSHRHFRHPFLQKTFCLLGNRLRHVIGTDDRHGERMNGDVPRIKRCRIIVIGTLGVLREAATLRLLDLRACVARLQTATFYVGPEVLKSLLGE